MKRISVLGIPLLIAILFAGSQAFAYGHVTIRVESPSFIDANTLGYNFGGDDRGKLDIWISFENEDVNIVGFQNGFKLYSPDGADWSAAPAEIEKLWDTTAFAFANAANCDNCDGLVADTFGFSAAGIAGGIPPFFSGDIGHLTVRLAQDEVNDGATICVDSVRLFGSPPRPWKWSLSNVTDQTPTVSGTRCWDVILVSGEPPETVQCGEADGDPFGALTSNDIDYGINYLFFDGPPPAWGFDTADVDDYEIYTISDLVHLSDRLQCHPPCTTCPPSQPPMEPEVRDTAIVDYWPIYINRGWTQHEMEITYYNDEFVQAFVFPFEILVDGQPLPPNSIIGFEWSVPLENLTGEKFKAIQIDSATNSFMIAAWRLAGVLPYGSWPLGTVRFAVTPGPTDKKASVQFTTFEPSQDGQNANTPMLITEERRVYFPDASSTDCCQSRTGNVDQDEFEWHDISDVIYLARSVLIGTVPMLCPAAANVDGDTFCFTDIGDILWLARRLMRGGGQESLCRHACEELATPVSTPDNQLAVPMTQTE
jgi:hypothetical protein